MWASNKLVDDNDSGSGMLSGSMLNNVDLDDGLATGMLDDVDNNAESLGQ